MSPTITFLTADSPEFISEQSRIILDVMQQLEKANLPIRNIVEIVVANSFKEHSLICMKIVAPKYKNGLSTAWQRTF